LGFNQIQPFSRLSLVEASVFRSLVVISAVALLGGMISQLKPAQADRQVELAWVRTSDGWEPGSVLTSQHTASVSPTLHPGLVAGLQLGASVFVLLAFPIHRQGLRTA
jgi:hypothetical protein